MPSDSSETKYGFHPRSVIVRRCEVLLKRLLQTMYVLPEDRINHQHENHSYWLNLIYIPSLNRSNRCTTRHISNYFHNTNTFKVVIAATNDVLFNTVFFNSVCEKDTEKTGYNFSNFSSYFWLVPQRLFIITKGIVHNRIEILLSTILLIYVPFFRH
jgi:hypothetical protein